MRCTNNENSSVAASLLLDDSDVHSARPSSKAVIQLGKVEGEVWGFTFEGDQLIETEEKKSWLFENRAKILAGCLTLLAAVLNLFGRWPKAIWALGVLSGMLLLWLIGSGILALTRRIFRRHDDKECIAREYPRLVQLFEQFKRMTSRENTRAFRYMLYNASAYRVDFVDQILGSYYIEETSVLQRKNQSVAPGTFTGIHAGRWPDRNRRM